MLLGICTFSTWFCIRASGGGGGGVTSLQDEEVERKGQRINGWSVGRSRQFTQIRIKNLYSTLDYYCSCWVSRWVPVHEMAHISICHKIYTSRCCCRACGDKREIGKHMAIARVFLNRKRWTPLPKWMVPQVEPICSQEANNWASTIEMRMIVRLGPAGCYLGYSCCSRRRSWSAGQQPWMNGLVGARRRWVVRVNNWSVQFFGKPQQQSFIDSFMHWNSGWYVSLLSVTICCTFSAR